MEAIKSIHQQCNSQHSCKIEDESKEDRTMQKLKEAISNDYIPAQHLSSQEGLETKQYWKHTKQYLRNRLWFPDIDKAIELSSLPSSDKYKII